MERLDLLVEKQGEIDDLILEVAGLAQQVKRAEEERDDARELARSGADMLQDAMLTVTHPAMNKPEFAEHIVHVRERIPQPVKPEPF